MNLLGLTNCRQQTKKDILRLLETNNRVGCVRWTGFGKSHMITELYHELSGKKLILTSTGALKIEFEEKGCNCITYKLLNSRIDDNMFLNKYTDIQYLFLDECHRVSPTNLWGQSLEKFMNKLNCKILGFTATPNRTDGINTIEYWFDNKQVSPMYINDAYKLNYINPITYVKSYFNIDIIKDQIKDLIKSKNVKTENYNLSKAEVDNIFGISEIIKKYYNKIKNGNKIIVFCNRVSDLKRMKNYYFKIFYKLFPDEEINTYISTYKDQLNVVLDKFKKSNRGINIIFTVNKLEEGIHIEGVNTVIFMRPTISEVKYLQQLGRGINGKQETLIFDFANNCNRVIKNKVKGIYSFKNHKVSNPKDSELNNLLELVTVNDYTVDIEKILDNINNKPTKEQEIYLKENAMNKTVPELSKDTGLEKQVIYLFYNYNNINYKKVGLNTYDYSYVDKHYKDKTVSELSKHTGIPVEAIRQHYKSKRIVNYKKENRFQYDYSYVDKHYKDKTVSELSKHTGISKGTIYDYYNSKQINDYKKIERTYYDYSYVDKHYKDKTVSELSKHTGIPGERIRNYYERNKIKDYKKERRNNGTKSNNR